VAAILVGCTLATISTVFPQVTWAASALAFLRDKVLG
jgi:hypothetical protein